MFSGPAGSDEMSLKSERNQRGGGRRRQPRPEAKAGWRRDSGTAKKPETKITGDEPENADLKLYDVLSDSLFHTSFQARSTGRAMSRPPVAALCAFRLARGSD